MQGAVWNAKGSPRRNVRYGTATQKLLICMYAIQIQDDPSYDCTIKSESVPRKEEQRRRERKATGP